MYLIVRVKWRVKYRIVQILEMRPLKAAFRRGSMPRSYDLREVWGKYISQPIDQGWCGASWAVTTVQVTTDRFAIMSKGAVTDILSPQHLLSCSNLSQQGCQGGHLTRAWNWIRKFGSVVPNVRRPRRLTSLRAYFIIYLRVFQAHQGRMLPLGRPNDRLRSFEEEKGSDRLVPAFQGNQNSTPSSWSRLQGGHGRGHYARDNDFRTSPRYVIYRFIHYHTLYN